LADELKQRNIKFEDVVNELTLRLEEVDEAQSKILQSNKKLDVCRGFFLNNYLRGKIETALIFLMVLVPSF